MNNTVIDDYLAALDPVDRAELERIRQIVHAAVPGVDECISYGMPGFKYKGKYLGGFNAFKNHLSFFPTGRPVEVLKNSLTDYKTSTGTVQFTVDNPIPEALIREMLQIRVDAIDGA